MPIANPTSAPASAGASFMPSPTIATFSPCSCSLVISLALSSGSTSAIKSSTPTSSATVAAVARLSPVSITTFIPDSRSLATASWESGLIGSDTPSRPSGSPSRATNIIVCPSLDSSSDTLVNSPKLTALSFMSFALPRSTTLFS